MRLYYNIILVYSTLIYTCKCKQRNNTKRASQNSTAVHILGQKGKSAFFSEDSKIRLKRATKKIEKVQKCTITQKKQGSFVTIFEKDTLIYATITCMKGLKYALHCIKCSSFS